MPYNRVSVDEDGISESGAAVGYSVFLLHIIYFLACLGTFGVCIWIRFDLDFWEWCVEISWYTYWNCTYVVMITMVIGAGTCLVAGWGVHKDSRALLLVVVVLHSILFILHITGATLICTYGVEESQILVAELNERLTRMVYLWDIDDRASRIMKIIMEYVGCCGATGGDDFIFSYKPIPAECRDPRTGSEWQYGCEQGLAFWLEPWTGTLAGVSVGLSVFDILLIALTMKSRTRISEIKEDY